MDTVCISAESSAGLAVPRVRESAVRDEWRERTISDVVRGIGERGHEDIRRLVLDVSMLSEDDARVASSEIYVMRLCVSCKRKVLLEYPDHKWCYSRRELAFEWCKATLGMATLPDGRIPTYVCMWPGVTLPRKTAPDGSKSEKEHRL